MEFLDIKTQTESEHNEHSDQIEPTAVVVNQQPEQHRSATPNLLEFATVLPPPPSEGCARVPRPTNAFMIYANQNRKGMAKQFPLDSNKEISKRLGHCWKDLDPERKGVYYALAKQVDADHKKKYPSKWKYDMYLF